MNKYRVWKCDNDEELLIEIFNGVDLLSVQKEFINKGYAIMDTFMHNHYFIRVQLKEVFENE